MKRTFNIQWLTIAIAVLALINISVQYLKPAVTLSLEPLESDIPVKIKPYSSNEDSVMIFIPHKVKVTNHRAKTLSVNGIYVYDTPTTDFEFENLIFDNNGFSLRNKPLELEQHLVLDSLLANFKLIDYLNLKNNDKIPPFLSRTFYYYQPLRVYAPLISQKLYRQSNFKTTVFKPFSQLKFPNPITIPDSLIRDTKAHPLVFTFKKSTNDKVQKYGSYEIIYDLESHQQELFDTYKVLHNMNDTEEILEFLQTPKHKIIQHYKK
ncbi:hypothetical protein [Riemerella columbina]|uniref:hypothetical protein n=1 Tax=Riemerella columbina TaxID=103810 RepID=UPI00037CA3AC|nr:hypothetical protein [Riemerella columbina]